MKKISRKGRPRKDAITKLKVMAWFRAVAEASGKTSAQLEREFADPNHIRKSKDKNQEIRPGLWDKYRRGEVEPRARPINENRVSVVQAVEAKYPGTARVLTLPLWKLLDFSQSMTMEELDEIEKSLPPRVQHLHVQENVLGKERLQAVHVGEAAPPPSQPGISITLDQWIMQVILVRKTMQIQQLGLIGLMRTKLETTNTRSSRKQNSVKKKTNLVQEKKKSPRLKQADLF